MSWSPSIFKDSTLTKLPRPISVLNISHSWDVHGSKTPLKDGISTTGHSLNGVRIAITGMVAINRLAVNIFTDADMLTEYETLKNILNVNTDGDKFEFFILHDSVAGVYRKYKQCHAESSNLSFGDDDQHAPVYTCEIISEDPTLYTTAPGL